MSENIPLPKDKNREHYIFTGISAESMQKAIELVIKINNEDDELEALYAFYEQVYRRKPINIRVGSYGGSVDMVLAFIRVIELSKTPIYTYAMGASMSAGFMIVLSGHKRFGYKYTTLLYHQLSTGMWGKLEEIKDDVAYYIVKQAMLEEIILRKTKLTAKMLEKANKQKKDWYMSVEYCLKYGIIDEIL